MRKATGPRALRLLVLIGSAPLGPAAAAPGEPPVAVSVCGMIEAAAKAQDLPVGFLTRLIWRESSFRPQVVSPAGAQGVAQFMPRTAGERGLADPFDPAQAIPKAAELLAALRLRFGNLGLAAAAYNAGPARVATWLEGHGGLPAETRSYVLTITRRPVEDWMAKDAGPAPADAAEPNLNCLQLAARIRSSEAVRFAGSALTAPWGVQLSGSFSKQAALSAYARARKSLASLIGDVQPMVLRGAVRSRGFSPFYRVRVPAATRGEADALCAKIRKAGGACAVLRS